MDPVTQGVLGASIACAVSNKNNVKIALFVGLLVVSSRPRYFNKI